MITYVPWGPQVMGMIEWGKNQNPQKSLGLPTKPKTNTWTKNYGKSKESHAEFPSLKNFQKELNDITCKKKTLYCFEYLKKIPSLIKPEGTPPPQKKDTCKIFLPQIFLPQCCQQPPPIKKQTEIDRYNEYVVHDKPVIK